MATVPQLSERLIRKAPLAKPRTGSQYYLMEDGSGRQSIKGFGVRIGREKKVFVLRFRNRPYTLGEFPHLPLKEAKRLALDKKTELEALTANSLPPPPPRVTLSKLKRRFFRVRIEPQRKNRTIEEYERHWRRHLLPRFGHLYIDHINLAMVEDMKLEMADRRVAFNRALQQLQAALSYAVKLGWLHENPAQDCSFYKEQPKRRRITEEEYQRLAAALVGAERAQLFSPSSLAALWTILLTGCRPFEVLGARLEWCTLNGPSPKICWPEGEAKGDRDGHQRGRTLWLPPSVARRLRRVPRSEGHPYLLPGGLPNQPLTDLSKAWARVLRLAGIDKLTLTDARRSFRSEAPRAGIPRESIAKLMGHAPGSEITDRVYLSFHDDEQREAAANMESHLSHLMGLEP